MIRRFAITDGKVHDRKRAVRDPDSGRMVTIDPRGGRVSRRQSSAPLDPVVQRALDESSRNRPAPVVWEDECPF